MIEKVVQQTKKKPYSKPQLQTYGDLKEVARAVGNTTSADGAASPPQHTKTA